jgi:hypothetical protein
MPEPKKLAGKDEDLPLLRSIIGLALISICYVQ